ncbi:sulfotransferase [Vreelandella titanicae]|uniref:Sulfotransferase family protein n=1 Tax=Vreelandella titanicae TaxID=664683 RepID=A0A558JDA6_9GAMM|nr:sulfotransferase [Halomonas titanicae]TVU91623.1 hypothetical protein FQP89_00375 [Halomonas titanicae]
MENKVFCISMQRTGTTSVGRFFSDAGLRWSGWADCRKNGWAESWYDGDYEKIFSSNDFLVKNAFEDSPWWAPGFYKILYHRFPDSKFILLTRDTNSWLNSMINHSNDNLIGEPERHCKIYRREKEFYEKNKFALLNKKSMCISEATEKYKEAYENHNREAIDFFGKKSPSSLFVGKLEDPDKWQNLASFLNIKISKGYNNHENSSSNPSSRNR